MQKCFPKSSINCQAQCMPNEELECKKKEKVGTNSENAKQSRNMRDLKTSAVVKADH